MLNYNSFFNQSIKDPEGFWKKQATLIDWFRFPDTILNRKNAPFYKWFEGGLLNTSYLALDYHVEHGRGDQAALIYDSPVTQSKQHFTYRELRDEVARVAGMLQQLGVKKGDRVVIYMPMIPQTIFAMLACARLGAIHSVVFGGFAPKELAIRIDSAEPKVIMAASGGIEIDKRIPYKPLVDNALALTHHQPDHVVWFQRPEIHAALDKARDKDWMKLLERSDAVDYVPVKATDPLYIIYTSGTTGKPKGVVRDHGGHAVAMKFSMKYIYDMVPGDVFWAASDVGWVVGHSYIVYAPLIHGCTTVLYEGKPVKTPDAASFWRVMSDYNVRVFFTAPTAFRAIRKEDPQGTLAKKYHCKKLKYIFLAGERCDISTLEWLQHISGVPVIDHWWQTESGWPMISNMPGLELMPVKPGSVGQPVCGYDCFILGPDGRELDPGKEGALVVKNPLPPGNLVNLWKNLENFLLSYMSEYPGYYLSGDSAYKDHEGYVFITGRMDDIINVAGHRLSTASMEEVVSSHPAVAECAVFGVDDPMKGQVPLGLVVIKDGMDVGEEQLQAELIGMVRNAVGPVASFKRVLIAKRLPKTRSGKTLRRTMRQIADGKPYKVPSTIEDANVLKELEELMHREELAVV
jgi:acyl-coenzyme A synthetase/AMP-(fatty) acid ligase